MSSKNLECYMYFSNVMKQNNIKEEHVVLKHVMEGN